MISREVLVTALERLSARLGEQDIVGEIALIGGTAMMIAFQARQSTKDVDAVFAPAAEIRRAAALVARELGLEEDWLNDAGKGFLSPAGQFTTAPLPVLPNLRVLVPTAPYMLGMKVAAARAGGGGRVGDKRDIEFLIRLLGLRTPEETIEVVRQYYADAALLPRCLYLVEEIFEGLSRGGAR